MTMILHWTLCLLIAYAGFLRCIEMTPAINVIVRVFTALTAPASLLYAAAPYLFKIQISSLSIAISAIVLIGICAELKFQWFGHLKPKIAPKPMEHPRA